MNERLTVNGEQLRNGSSCASLGRGERPARQRSCGTHDPTKRSCGTHDPTKSKISAIVHCSLLIVTLSATAAEIWTEEWGTFWKCPEPKNKYKTIWTHETPGSDDYGTVSNNARIARHFYYAWMDGFDTREWAMTNRLTTSQPPSPATNLPSYARFAFRTNFVPRLHKLLEYKIGPSLTGTYYPDGIFWGSTAMDEVFENLGWPAKEDFYWTKDPTDKCWDYGTAWLPAFVTLDHHFYASYFAGDNDALGYWCGGIAAKKGWLGVVWQDDPDFGGYVRAASSENAGNYYFATMDKDFEYVISNTFDSVISREAVKTNVLNYVSYDGGRLYYDTIATADQALACFDKTYHFPGDIYAVTNMTKGWGSVKYNLEGKVRKKLTVRGGVDPFIGFDDGEYSDTYDWHVTDVTNSISITRYPSGRTSPFAAASRITTEVGVSGDVILADAPLVNFPMSLTKDDLGEDLSLLLAELGKTRADVTLTVALGEYGITWTADLEGSSVEGYKNAGGVDLNTNVTLHVGAIVKFEYRFTDELSYSVRDVKEANWLYPSNAYYVGSATMDKPGWEFDFFLSYARCNAYDDYNMTADLLWDYVSDYKYRFWHEEGYQAGDYLPALSHALSINAQAAAWAFDSKNPYIPRAYVGADEEEVIACVSGAKCIGGAWGGGLTDEPGWTHDPERIVMTRTISVRLLDDGVEITPAVMEVAGFGVYPAFGDFGLDTLDRPGDRMCETRIKGITEVRWKFPQVKFDSL